MNVLITMGGARYDAITERVLADAPQLGADRVLVYDDVWVDAHPFRKLNAWLWDHPGDRNGKRGYGWYAWKPLILLDACERQAPGDVVLYLDADSRPVSSMLPIFDTARRDGAMFFASQGHRQRTWCKADCYKVMGQTANDVDDVSAGCARFVAIRAGEYKPRQLLWEWLTYAVNPLATTFDPSSLQDEEVFNMQRRDLGPLEEHRTEQAIMTNLAHRYGYKLWRECDESGEGWDVDRDVLPVQVFEQTRAGGGNLPGGSKFRNVEMPK